MAANQIEVSVIILTFNPDMDALRKTIMSIVKQKKISIELILSDDGSSHYKQNEIEQLLKEISDIDYIYLKNNKNIGTVNNYFNAVKLSKGSFVKGISTGDFLYDELTLYKWITYMKERHLVWSFGDAKYYSNIKCGMNVELHPKIILPYQKNNIDICRYFYVVNDDKCLGAAVLCKRNELLEYLQKINNIVRYAEDYIFQLMMIDDMSFGYFPYPVIFYEYGDGISTTNNSQWVKKLDEDKKNFLKYLIKYCDNNNLFQENIIKSIKNKKNKKIIRFLNGVFIRTRIRFWFYKLIFQRKGKIVSEFLWWK